MRTLTALLREQSGTTAIEYSLIVSLISIVLIAALFSVGRNLNATFNTIAVAMAGEFTN
jgi:pilus assembly protein Flp/PilA